MGFQCDADSFCAKCFGSKEGKDDNFSQFTARTDFDRWIALSGVKTSYEDLRDLLIREKYLHCSSSDLATFVRECGVFSIEKKVQSTELAHSKIEPKIE